MRHTRPRVATRPAFLLWALPFLGLALDGAQVAVFSGLVDADYYYPARNSLQIDGPRVAVSPFSVEYPNLHVGISLEFTESTLTVTFPPGGYGFNAVTFNGVVVTNLAGDFGAVSLLSSSGPFTADRVSFQGNVLDLNFAGLSTGPGASFTLLASPVPEPPGWALLGAGSFLLLFARLRRWNGRRA